MTETIDNFQTKIKIGAEQSYKNMTMFPLLYECSIASTHLNVNELPADGLIENDALDGINSVPKSRVVQISGENDRVAASGDYVQQFARVDGQVGAIFLINGKMAGIVCLEETKTFELSFIKILECYAKKAADEFDSAMNLRSLKSEVLNYLRTPCNSQIEIQSTTGI